MRRTTTIIAAMLAVFGAAAFAQPTSEKLRDLPGVFRFPPPATVEPEPAPSSPLLIRDMMHNRNQRHDGPVGLLARCDGVLNVYMERLLREIVRPMVDHYGERHSPVVLQFISPFGVVDELMGPLPMTPDETLVAPWTGRELLAAAADAWRAEFGDELHAPIISLHLGDVGRRPLVAYELWAEAADDLGVELHVSLDAWSNLLKAAPETAELVADHAIGSLGADRVMLESGVWPGAGTHDEGVASRLRASGVWWMSVVAGEAEGGRFRPTGETLRAADPPRGRDCWVITRFMTPDEAEWTSRWCAGRGDMLAVPVHAWVTVIAPAEGLRE